MYMCMYNYTNVCVVMLDGELETRLYVQYTCKIFDS